MPAAPPSQRRERAELSARLRAAGRTWPEIAEAIRSRYRVNARVAMRLAHGWSQREVAGQWTSAWPDDPKTLKHISYWEQWPAETGHEPGLNVLANLASLYQCSIGDLLADLGDYRHTDSAMILRADAGVQSVLAGLALPPRQQASIDVTEFAQAVTMWGEKLSPDLDRRTLLFRLSGAFALAAAAPVFEKITSDLQRLAGAPDDAPRLDGESLDRVEAIIADCRRHGDILGPAVTLQCVMAEREVLAAILRGRLPAALERRAESAYAELSQLAGWLLFNLGDFHAAAHYYDEARTVAHAAQDTDLVTYVLCTMSHMATWTGQPRVGIDHAVAAQTWARRTANPLALAYAADVTARAYAADNASALDCDTALALEHEALQAEPANPHVPDRWYFYDESFRLGTEAETSLLLGRPAAALDAAGRSLALIDPANLHNRVMTQALQAEAVILQGDGCGACTLIAGIARTTVGNTSRRIDDRITGLRRELGPWGRTAAVRDLDEQLRLYRRPA
jgi:tetratricopeptide (TPR) repeat protein